MKLKTVSGVELKNLKEVKTRALFRQRIMESLTEFKKPFSCTALHSVTFDQTYRSLGLEYRSSHQSSFSQFRRTFGANKHM